MLKQFDKISHPEFGDGYVVYVQYRRKSSLAMIYVPSEKKHEFLLEKDAYKYKIQ